MQSSLKAAETNWRSGSQPLMPVRIQKERHQGYDVFPWHSLGDGKIHTGFGSLAERITGEKLVCIDGFAGVFWQNIEAALEEELLNRGLKVRWVHMTDFLKPEPAIEDMVRPFLGTPGSVWGTRTTLSLSDFYQFNDPPAAAENADITIVIGPGAALLYKDAFLIYIDLPKNELQLRMRAGSIYNLGADKLNSNAEMYKRYYFVDWVVLNEHKKNILPRIDIVADAQWEDDINWMEADDFTAGLQKLAHTAFRVRPWFEAGAWGGQWMKKHIDGINKDEINYAWSFELIVPENGLVFESDGYLLEVSFDFLMFAQREAVLGRFADRFGDEFPIRFDFLDTWDGGNLSIQCHPNVKYIRENFGETITQDETYYILDCTEDAGVYLGFQEGINPSAFKTALEDSRDKGVELEITDYVQLHHAKKHDLFLIPNGTVHSAGAGNLVLEISATPYIFTFKMYDWLRLDLNGQPRAINIDHAFNNLRFERQGEKVKQELISKPAVIAGGDDWLLIHLPTHADHFYDVHRIEFDGSITVETDGSCHVLMLVEGASLTVSTTDGNEMVYYYAETFVVPAAAKSYTLQNRGNTRAKVIKAFLKPM